MNKNYQSSMRTVSRHANVPGAVIGTNLSIRLWDSDCFHFVEILKTLEIIKVVKCRVVKRLHIG